MHDPVSVNHCGRRHVYDMSHGMKLPLRIFLISIQHKMNCNLFMVREITEQLVFGVLLASTIALAINTFANCVGIAYDLLPICYYLHSSVRQGAPFV
jgi:hypothetical protein